MHLVKVPIPESNQTQASFFPLKTVFPWQFWDISRRKTVQHFAKPFFFWSFPENYSALFLMAFLARLSTKCSWWAIVIGQCPLCIVLHQQLLYSYKPTPSTPLGQWTWNLVGSIGATRKSKIANNPRGRHGCHLENLFFDSFPEPKGQLLKLGRKHWGDF